MKKCFYIAILAVSCIFAAIFAFTGVQNRELISQDEILYDKLTTKCHSRQVFKLAEQGTEMTDFFKQLGIRRYKSSFGMFYTIIDTYDTGLLQIYFDSSGKYCGAIRIELTDCLKADLEQIQQGMTFDDVKQVDHAAKLATFSWSGTPVASYHFTRDGYAFKIFYESDVITSILCWTI